LKKRLLFLLPLAVLPAVLFIAANAPANRTPGFNDAVPDGELADQITAAMTDEELLAQILMFGWAGEDPGPQVISWVQDHSLGSIKIFGWNTDNTEKVAGSISFLQKKAESGRFGIPLVVATDQ